MLGLNAFKIVFYESLEKLFSPECVNLFDHVEGVLAELDVVRGLPAALVLVGRDVSPEGLQVAQAVPRHSDVCAFPFDQLKKDFRR